MNKKHLFWIIPLSIIIGVTLFLVIIFNVSTAKSENILDKPIEPYWACMDGCFEMQKMVYGNFNGENKSMKRLHCLCTSECSNLYLIEGGHKDFCD